LVRGRYGALSPPDAQARPAGEVLGPSAVSSISIPHLSRNGSSSRTYRAPEAVAGRVDLAGFLLARGDDAHHLAVPHLLTLEKKLRQPLLGLYNLPFDGAGCINALTVDKISDVGSELSAGDGESQRSRRAHDRASHTRSSDTRRSDTGTAKMCAVTHVEPHTTMGGGTRSRREKHPEKTDTGTQPLEVDIGLRDNHSRWT
jgi:hypothetical protein